MFTLFVLTLYLILDLFRPEILFPDLSEGLMLSVGVALIIVCAVETMVLGWGWPSYPSTPYAIGLLVIGGISSIVASLNGVEGNLPRFLDIPKLLVIYFAVVQAVRSKRRLNYLLWVLVVPITVLAVGSICYASGVPLPGYNYDGGGRLQYVGIYEDSNDFGLMFAVAWAVVLYTVVNGQGIKGRIWHLCTLVPLGWAILLTASRGAELAALTAVFLAFRRRFHMMLPAAVTLAILVTMNQMGIARMDRLSSDEASAENRLMAWGQGWYMFRAHPIIGLGPHNFTLEHFKGAHSTLVQAASEMGLIGLACTIGFFYFPLREFANVDWLRGKATESSFVVSQLQTALMSCMVASLFLSRLYINTPYLLTGLVLVARDLTENPAEEQARSAPPLTLAKLGRFTVFAVLAWRIVARNFISGL